MQALKKEREVSFEKGIRVSRNSGISSNNTAAQTEDWKPASSISSSLKNLVYCKAEQNLEITIQGGVITMANLGSLSFSGKATIPQGTYYLPTEDGIHFKGGAVIHLNGTINEGAGWQGEIRNVSAIKFTGDLKKVA